MPTPAAFGRLRVETQSEPKHSPLGLTPAAFGRLRVETSGGGGGSSGGGASRLRAAAC